MSVLRYSVDWHDDAESVAPEERATVADFRLFLQEQNVTLHLRENELSELVTIALYTLAEALAHDWWRLFGGRDRQLSLIRHRGGFAVPDIRMSFDGAAFEIAAFQGVYRNPDVRFWAGPSEIMSRRGAETVLSGFVDDVLDRLRTRGVPGTSAASRWARVQASRADPEEAAFCEAAGALDLDPYAVDERGADLIQKAAGFFSGEPLTEFLAGLGSADRDRLVTWVDAVERRPPAQARLADLRAMAEDAARRAPAGDLEPGWKLGYRRAQAMRHVLGLQPGHRFASFGKLAEKLGATSSFKIAGRVDGLRALRSDHADGVYIHLREHGSSTYARASHLFSFARAVGDAACFPAEVRSPVNELHAACRQAAGRAFAAEFLAPISEVRSMREDGRDSVSAAADFGVSTPVIERQWENRERIAVALGQE